jgi:hypothetical protein
MGASSSSTIKIQNETINSTVLDVLNKTVNESQQSGMSVQSIDLSDAEITSCQLNISQESKISLTAMQEIDSKTSADLVSDIMTKVKQEIDNAAAAKTGFLSQPSNATSVTDTINSVKNELSANLTTENINKIIQNVNQQQTIKGTKLKYDACNAGILVQVPKLADTEVGLKIGECIVENKPCNLSQITSTAIVSQQITTSVMGIIADNKAVQDLDQKLSSKAEAESTGPISELFAGIAGVFGAISGPYAAAVLFSCCCCCCCLIVLMVMGAMGSMGSGKVPSAASLKNAAKAGVPGAAVAANAAKAGAAVAANAAKAGVPVAANAAAAVAGAAVATP